MFINGRYVGPMFQQDLGAGSGGSDNTNANANQSQNQQQEQAKGLREQLTDDQRKELDSQIAAARRQAEADARAKFEGDANQAKADAQAAADRQKQIDQGQFNEAKASLEGERDTFKSQAETEKARADRAIKLLKGQVDERVKALPPSIANQFPKDKDVLDQLEWLDDPRTKAVIEAAGGSTNRLTGNPQAPRPNGTTDPKALEETRKKELRNDTQYAL